MSLTNEQINSLIDQVVGTEPDELDCDGCFAQLAEFADRELSNLAIPQALKVVETHLAQCTCCRDEYAALLEGLRALD